MYDEQQTDHIEVMPLCFTSVWFGNVLASQPISGN